MVVWSRRHGSAHNSLGGWSGLVLVPAPCSADSIPELRDHAGHQFQPGPGYCYISRWKYVLTVMDDKGQNSLWLRNVATGSDTQVVPPSAAIANVAFSPDGNYIFFRKAENAIASDFNIYRAPVLGGTPKSVVHDVDSAFAFSPDGRRVAYIRANNPETGKYRLLHANLDGSDEKVLHIEAMRSLARWLAWSPNGKQLAYPEVQPGTALGGINLYDLNTGNIQPLTFADKTIAEMIWSSSGDGLFVIYQQKGPSYNRLRSAS